MIACNFPPKVYFDILFTKLDTSDCISCDILQKMVLYNIIRIQNPFISLDILSTQMTH